MLAVRKLVSSSISRAAISSCRAAPSRAAVSYGCARGIRFYSAEAEKEYDPKITSIVDSISKLTLLEVADLNTLLKVC